MRKLIVFENSICEIEQADMPMVNALLEMSKKIKESLGLPYQPIQLDSKNKIRIERIIGNISLNEVNLIVLPKVLISHESDAESVSMLKAFYLRTIKSAGDRLNSTIYFSKNSIVDDQKLLLEVLAQYYYESLARAVKLSTISTYESIEQKKLTVKGRILVRKQLSEPIADAKIWCRYKKISTDNAYNALLTWACKFFVSSIKDVAMKKKLITLVQDIGSQSEELSYQLVSNLRLPRQYAIYKDGFLIAQNLYLRHSGKRENDLGNHMSGYVISTERAFERIVEAFCKKSATILGCEHRAQAKTQLAKSSLGKEYDYYVIPDDLFYTKDNRLVVDAKYKLICYEGTQNKPIREDFYQMISSCIAQKTMEAVLVYPKVSGVVPISWKVTEKINGGNYIIWSAFIDMFGTDESILNDMMNLLKATSFFGVIA